MVGMLYCSCAVSVPGYILFTEDSGLGCFVPFGWITYTLYLTYDGVFKLFIGKGSVQMYVVLFVVMFAVAGLLAWLRELLISWNNKMRRKGSM